MSDHRHVWSFSSSRRTRVCDVVGCGKVRTSGKPLDHVVCPNCWRGDTYLCGASRDDQIGGLHPLTESFIGEPCPVCFENDTMTCSNCGEEIQCR